MVIIRKIMICLALFAGVFIYSSLMADDSSTEYYPQSGNVFPVKNNSIRMVSEEVTYKDGKFTTIFNFQNVTDKEQVVELAYPITGNFGIGHQRIERDQLLSKDEIARKIEENYQFRSTIDGQKVKRELKEVNTNTDKDDNYEFIYVTPLKFAPNESHIVINTYNQKPVIASNVTGSSSETLTYILKTGAYWNSPIGDAKFKFFFDKGSFKPGQFFARENPYLLKREIYTSPNTEKIDDREHTICSWVFKNLEPTENLEVTINWRGYSLNELIDIIDLINSNNISKIKKDHNDFLQEMAKKDYFEEFIMAILMKYKNEFKGRLILKKEDCDFYDKLGRFAVNSLYAIKGYKFNKQSLGEFYNLFPWYSSNSNAYKFSVEEQELIKSASEFKEKVILK